MHALVHGKYRYGLAGGGILGAILWLAGESLPRMFTDSQEVVSTATTPLQYVIALQPLNALVFVLDGIFVGASDFGYLALVCDSVYNRLCISSFFPACTQ